MAYYTTENLARIAGCSPAAARYYLRKSGFTAKITDHRFPRHSRQYSWPETALAPQPSHRSPHQHRALTTTLAHPR